MIGRINSIQSLGATDGPGIRFVVFMQGCPLRCGCCHNPDTWDMAGGTEIEAEEIKNRVLRYREYFGAAGGITISGGEPLLQAEFTSEVFALCKEAGINTCLDTSGCLWNEETEQLLAVTDRVLLDIKYTDDALYREAVGCSINEPLLFLEKLEERKIPTTLRQVIIPSLNDNEENIRALAQIAKEHRCIDKIELLPFKKLCSAKYDNLGIPFPFGHIPEPSRDKMRELENLL